MEHKSKPKKYKTGRPKSKYLESVLVLTSSFPAQKNISVGGGEFVLRLCQEISKKYQPVVLAPKFPNSLNEEIIDEIMVRRFGFLPFNKWYNYFNYGIFAGFKTNLWLSPFFITFFIQQLFYSIRLIRQYDIKIIHAHWIFPQGMTAVLLKYILYKRNLKIITTSHGSDIFSLNFLKPIKLWVLKKSTLITVVSSYLKGVLKTDYGIYKNVVVAPMGIDTQFFNPNLKDQKLQSSYFKSPTNFLLFVGRLSQVKGIKYLIHAMPDILLKHKNTKLIIIGDGELRAELKNMVDKLNIKHAIFFEGFKTHEELRKYFATADIFIGPSLKEGFGLVFAEAASCGCIVVATDFPAVQDIIINNESGFIIKKKSSKAISEKVNFLIENKYIWKEMMKNSRNHIVSNFDWKIIGSEYVNLIDSLKIN